METESQAPDWRAHAAQVRATFKEACERHGLAVVITRDPDTSPATKENPAMFRFSCVVMRGARHILTTPYSMGVGHAKPWKPAVGGSPRRADVAAALAETVRTGCKVRHPDTFATVDIWPTPDVVDVVSSLCIDSDVLNAGGFEEWASEYGYEVDSRKAEAIYRACLDIGLKMRAAIGGAALAELCELGREL